MPTIAVKEVAKIARVSTATVSRVLNGSDVVIPTTKAKVLRAIEETGFKKNEAAAVLGRMTKNQSQTRPTPPVTV